MVGAAEHAAMQPAVRGLDYLDTDTPAQVSTHPHHMHLWKAAPFVISNVLPTALMTVIRLQTFLLTLALPDLMLGAEHIASQAMERGTGIHKCRKLKMV